MKIQQLRHFVAAAESASFAQAAKRCFTSRQNIAHSVHEIESELGVSLIERRGNEIVLTPVGERAIDPVRLIVDDVDALKVMFVKRTQDASPLNLAVSMNLFAGISRQTSAYFSERSSQFHFFELESNDCYQAVCSGKADAALVMCMKRDFPDCSVIEIATSPSFMLFRDASPLSRNMVVEVSELKGQRLSLMSKPPFQYEPLFKQLDLMGFSRERASVITSTSTMLSMVRQHGFAGIVSEKFALSPPKGTVAVPFADARFHWHFYFLYRRNVGDFHSVIECARDIRATFDEAARAAEASIASEKVAGGGASKCDSSRRRRRGNFQPSSRKQGGVAWRSSSCAISSLPLKREAMRLRRRNATPRGRT